MEISEQDYNTLKEKADLNDYKLGKMVEPLYKEKQQLEAQNKELKEKLEKSIKNTDESINNTQRAIENTQILLEENNELKTKNKKILNLNAKVIDENRKLKEEIDDLQQSHDNYVKEVWNQHMDLQKYKQFAESVKEYYTKLGLNPVWGNDDDTVKFVEVWQKLRQLIENLNNKGEKE